MTYFMCCTIEHRLYKLLNEIVFQIKLKHILDTVAGGMATDVIRTDAPSGAAAATLTIGYSQKRYHLILVVSSFFQ